MRNADKRNIHRKWWSSLQQVTLKPANNLTTIKAIRLFLEDNESIDTNNKHIVKNLPIPTNIKDAVNEEYWHNNLKTSDTKIHILS